MNQRFKTEKYELSIQVLETEVMFLKISKKDFTKLQKQLVERVKENAENESMLSNVLDTRHCETETYDVWIYTYRFGLTDIELTKKVCKDGYVFITK